MTETVISVAAILAIALAILAALYVVVRNAVAPAAAIVSQAPPMELQIIVRRLVRAPRWVPARFLPWFILR